MRKAKQSGESVWEVQLFWSSRKVRNKIEGGDNYQHITFTEHILYARQFMGLPKYYSFNSHTNPKEYIGMVILLILSFFR